MSYFQNTDRDSVILAKTEAGMRPAEIAREMDLSKNTVVGVIYRDAARKERALRPPKPPREKVERSKGPKKEAPPKFWNEERDAFVRQHYGKGKTADVIGAEIGCSRSAVIGYAKRAGLCVSKDDWTVRRKAEAERHRQRRRALGQAPSQTVLERHADIAETVKSARLDGVGPVEIAKRLDIDVNRIHRIITALRKTGVEFPKLSTVARVEPKPKAEPIRASFSRGAEPQAPQVELLESARPAWKPLEGSSPKVLADPRQKGCKWPVGPGEGAEQLFCSEPVRGEGPYCVCHHRIAHRPATKGEGKIGRMVARHVSFERKVFAA